MSVALCTASGDDKLIGCKSNESASRKGNGFFMTSRYSPRDLKIPSCRLSRVAGVSKSPASREIKSLRNPKKARIFPEDSTSAWSLSLQVSKSSTLVGSKSHQNLITTQENATFFLSWPFYKTGHRIFPAVDIHHPIPATTPTNINLRRSAARAQLRSYSHVVCSLIPFRSKGGASIL